MRRIVIPAVFAAAVLGGVSAVTLSGTGSEREQILVSVPSTAAVNETEASPAELETQPPRQVLQLEPVAYNLAELDLENDSGALGVPWIDTKDSIDPETFLVNDEQRRIYNLLATCFPARNTNPAVDVLFEAKTVCFDPKAIYEAATISDPTDLFDALHALNLARPDVFAVCHNGSHKIGKLVFERAYRKHGFDVDIFRQLLSAGRSTCMGGLVHGLLDAVGFVADDVSEYRGIIEACASSVRSAAAQCGDAVGHSVWDAFETVSDGAAACAYFADEQMRNDCSEGLLMRKYQRLERTSEWYTGIAGPDEFDRWIAETVANCDSWPSIPYAAAPGVDPREGCWRGVIYPLTQPVFRQLRLTNGEYPQAKEVMLPMVKKIVTACGTFSERGNTLCLERLGVYVGHLVMFDRAEARIMCDLWPQKARTSCNEEAEQRIISAENGT